MNITSVSKQRSCCYEPTFPLIRPYVRLSVFSPVNPTGGRGEDPDPVEPLIFSHPDPLLFSLDPDPYLPITTDL